MQVSRPMEELRLMVPADQVSQTWQGMKTYSRIQTENDPGITRVMR